MPSNVLMHVLCFPQVFMHWNFLLVHKDLEQVFSTGGARLPKVALGLLVSGMQHCKQKIYLFITANG